MKRVTLIMLFIICAMSRLAFAQGDRIKVEGRVYDSDGEPLIGATVLEKGTTNGTIADADGWFQLMVPSARPVTLEITYLGYKPLEVMSNSPMLKEPLRLELDALQIDNVVVIGYGTVRKSDLTGSVVSLKSDLDQIGQATTATDMLLGKVPGLQITPGNGAPGAGATVRIRGGASLSAINTPLVVIDGVPVADNSSPGMGNPLSVINPNDIASYTVLKDASATAIYGSRGSNGVIIIVTKKGSQGRKFKINYNSTYSAAVNGRTVNNLTGDEYRTFIDTYFPASTAIGATAHGLLGSANTDWQKEIYRVGLGTDQYLSASGNITAGDVMTMPYRVAFGYTNENGTLRGSKYERYTGSIGLTPTFFDNHLTIDINAKATWNNNSFAEEGAVGGAVFFDPTQVVRDEQKYSQYNGYYTWTSGGLPNSLPGLNPVALLEQKYDKTQVFRSIGNVQIDYKMHFLPELRANLNLGYDLTLNKGHKGDMIGSPMAWKDSDYRGVGRNTWTWNRRENQLLDFYLNYTKDIGKNHVEAMVGYSWQHFYTQDYGSTYVNGGAADAPPVSSTDFATENYLVSFFGRVNYGYDNRYMATVTVRGDGSSRFSKANRWGVFPSLAVAWNLAGESWLKSNHDVSVLKLRASWGVTGQQDLGLDDYPYIARYNLSDQFSKYQFGNTFYNVLKPEAYDEHIKWEETTSYNVGFDFGFWNNRLIGSVDVYYKQTKDLLNTVPVAAGSNFSNEIITNIGSLNNRGVEVSLSGDIIQTRDWNWNVGVNATWYRTRITQLTANANPDYKGVMFGGISGVVGSTAQIHSVGHNPGAYYVYEQVYDASGMPLQNVFVDRNGDGQINEADRYLYQKPSPTVYMGLSSTLTFRNWDLSFSLHANLGNYLFNDVAGANSSTVGAFSNQGFLTNVTDQYKKTGFTSYNSAPQRLSDHWVENASFLRMDNITVGYNFRFPNTDMGGRVSFTAQNVFVITNYDGLDPENSNGVDNGIWPRPRTFVLGLTLNF